MKDEKHVAEPEPVEVEAPALVEEQIPEVDFSAASYICYALIFALGYFLGGIDSWS